MIPYKLLIKFPTRGRVKKFFEVLDLYYKYSIDLKNTKFVISCDEDDLTMNNDYVKNKFYHYKNLNYYYGKNKSKIEAINADMEHDTDWDICLLASDDMIPQSEGYDNIIRNKMFEYFKNTDGVLWFYDGMQERLNTLSIFGKKYYDRFGYIYNPSYYSLWCDNEFHQVADILNKQVYIKNCIIKHEHPAWGYGVADELMKRNDTYYKDEFIFNRRKDIYFNINFDDIIKYENRLKKGNSNVNEKNIIPGKIELKQNIEKPIEEVQNPTKVVQLNSDKPSHSVLNDFVDKVYVINLKRRKDRLDHMTEELQRFHISFEKFNAIDGQKLNISEDTVRNAQIGCLRSHIGILKKALKSGHNKIAIFEDDIILCDDFEDRFKYYSEQVPDNWDIMYLGCNLNQCKFPTRIKPYIHRVLKSYGCFALILNNNNNLFQKIIDITEKEEKPIDNYYHDDILKISNAYLFFPFFVKTLITESDISQNKGKILYDVVNKHFINNVKLPKKVQDDPIQRIENKTVREICEDYLRGMLPFQIYYDNKVIFDSSSSDKINVNFFDDYFTLYGRIFSYRGMKIRNK